VKKNKIAQILIGCVLIIISSYLSYAQLTYCHYGVPNGIGGVCRLIVEVDECDIAEVSDCTQCPPISTFGISRCCHRQWGFCTWDPFHQAPINEKGGATIGNWEFCDAACGNFDPVLGGGGDPPPGPIWPDPTPVQPPDTLPYVEPTVIG
jgi:hypothetical protein